MNGPHQRQQCLVAVDRDGAPVERWVDPPLQLKYPPGPTAKNSHISVIGQRRFIDHGAQEQQAIDSAANWYPERSNAGPHAAADAPGRRL